MLERVFHEVVRRHEVLRTTFATAAGEPRQVIAAQLTPALPVIDLGALPAPRGELEAQRLAAVEARRPLDLTRGPLIRFTLLRLAAEDQAVLVTMHHIVSDGWSMGVLKHGDLARRLGPDQPFYGLQVPDREGEHFLTTIEEMAEHYVEALLEVQPEGPYRLGGWSMGGLIAFEMARQLSEQHQRVERLVLIDSVAPAARQRRPEATGDAELALGFAMDLAGIFGVAVPVSPADIETFHTAEEVLAFLHEKMQAARLVPPDLGLSEIIRLFATFKINVRAMECYGPPACSGRLVLFKAGERLSQAPEASDLGWGELVGGGLEIREVEGNHYSMLREPHVEVLADGLREVLDAARAPGGAHALGRRLV